MDELSQGVALRSLDTRVQAEVLHFVMGWTRPKKTLYPSEQMVWTRSAFALQMLLPEVEWLPPDTKLAIQNGFHDLLWSHSLEEMMEHLDGAEAPLEWLQGMAERLTNGKFTHASELVTFDDALRAELSGAIDSHGEAVDGTMPYLFERTTGRRGPTGVKDNKLRGVITSLLLHDRTSRALPTINVQAGIHAAHRWDRRRRYRANDWIDVMHAAAALPYCSALLTEKSLAVLIKSGHLRYDRRYDCWTEWDPARAAKQLECLL